MRAFIDRFRYQATKAAQVQSRIKMLDKIVPIEVPPERKRVHFTFPSCPKSGRIGARARRTSARPTATTSCFDRINLHIERGDRIALVAPNGAGKSTLMRLLAGAEPPDRGTRREGHQVVMQYFAQDEANRLEPAQTVYETMEADSPVGMVPMIRNILGGFLFSGDDIYKKAGVLSGGERTRLAVARMLLRPANTLLLDEPTNHLDLDSKDVLLEALEDFGGTLIFVSHDRYFVDRLATKIIEVGHGDDRGLSRAPTSSSSGAGRSARQPRRPHRPAAADAAARPPPPRPPPGPRPPDRRRRTRLSRARRQPAAAYDEKKQSATPRPAPATRAADERDAPDRRPRSADRRARTARSRSSKPRWRRPGFYDDRAAAESVIDPAPGPDVGGRRPDESVGSAPDRRSRRLKSQLLHLCN